MSGIEEVCAKSEAQCGRSTTSSAEDDNRKTGKEMGMERWASKKLFFTVSPDLPWSSFHVLRLGMNVQSSSEYVKTILSCILGKQCFILRNKKERIQP